MKKHFKGLAIAAVALAAVLAIGYSTLAASRAKNNQINNSSAPSAESYITEVAAKEAAFAHAGLAEKDVSLVRIELDFEHGRTKYDVEFYSGNKEYDYEIDAVTGTVLSTDYDFENDDYLRDGGSVAPDMGAAVADTGAAPGAAAPDTGAPTAADDGTAYIDAATAKQAALAHAGFTEASVFELKAEFDFDHGKAVYEVDFQVGRTEYEFDIDAVTGEVIFYRTELDD